MNTQVLLFAMPVMFTSTPGNEKALFQAAKEGNTTTVAALLEAGTNANCRDEVCLCVCVCACVRVYACVRVCVCVCMWQARAMSKP